MIYMLRQANVNAVSFISDITSISAGNSLADSKPKSLSISQTSDVEVKRTKARGYYFSAFFAKRFALIRLELLLIEKSFLFDSELIKHVPQSKV